MSEKTLKELSDAATQGEMRQPDWGSDLRVGKTLVGMMSPAPEGNGKANGAYLCRLWNDRRAGRLHTDAELTDAVAHARRDALAEVLSDEHVEALSRQLAVALLEPAPMQSGKLDPLRRLRPIVRDLYASIRALADTLPEARQPETGAENLRIALRIFKDSGHDGAMHAVRQWLRAGEVGPIPAPEGACFWTWAEANGLANVEGFIRPAPPQPPAPALGSQGGEP